MATHEENMKDPVWLADQMGRYKAELATASTERNSLREQVKALEVQRDAQIKRGNDALDVCDQLRVEATAKDSQLATLLEERKDYLTRMNDVVAENNRLAALATRRKVALASIVQAVGKTLEIAAPLLDE